MIKNILPAVLFICVAAIIITPAQFNPESAMKQAQDKFFDIKNRSVELERIKRDAEKRPEIDNTSNTSLKFPEIKEDFEEIQKLNEKVIQLSEGRSQINYIDILNLVSEINHRAMRLKSNLFVEIPKTKKEAKIKQQINDKPQDIKTLLEALEKNIDTFVHSPIFQNLNVINTDDSLQAQKDLETVIKTSSEVKNKPVTKSGSDNFN